MADVALVYLFRRLMFRIGSFFEHWYHDGSVWFFHACISSLEHFDQTLAIRVTLAHFSEPLYKDYTIIGRVLGVIFRSGRICIGGIFYFFLVAIYAAFLLLWLLLPVFFVGLAIYSLS